MRSDLTAALQVEHLAKRKELWSIKNTGAGQPKQFAAETAEAAGVSKRMVNKATARADHIT